MKKSNKLTPADREADLKVELETALDELWEAREELTLANDLNRELINESRTILIALRLAYRNSGETV